MDHRAAFFLALFALSVAEPISLKFYPHNEDKNETLIWYNMSMYHAWSHQLDNLLEDKQRSFMIPTRFATNKTATIKMVPRLISVLSTRQIDARDATRYIPRCFSTIGFFEEEDLDQVYSNPKHTEGRKENLINCSYTKLPTEGKICNIPVHHFKPCTSKNHFGYKKGTPCIFLELHKSENWKPRFFNSTKSLPKSMPQALKSYIQSVTQVNPKTWQTVWVSCEGETPSDIEFIGPVHYLPQQGIPSYLLSGSETKGYLPPIMAIYLEAPVRGVVINIECRAWVPAATNDSKTVVATTKFQYLIDD